MAAQNLANTKAEIFGSIVQKELKENAPLLGIVSDFSNLAGKGVSSISIPKMTSFTVQSRAFGAAASENGALVDSVDTILLDQNKIVLWGYDEHDAMQSSINYQMVAAERAATAHARDVNSAIVTGLAAVAGHSEGALADISVDNILNMRQFLFQNFADMNNVALVIAADQEKAMLKLPEFSRYDYRGGVAPIVSGTIGSVYGIPVILSQAVPLGEAFMCEKNGFAISFQMSPKYAENTALKYGTGGKEAAVDQLYGVGGLQLGEGLLIDNTTAMTAGKSPLVAKLL